MAKFKWRKLKASTPEVWSADCEGVGLIRCEQGLHVVPIVSCYAKVALNCRWFVYTGYGPLDCVFTKGYDTKAQAIQAAEDWAVSG